MQFRPLAPRPLYHPTHRCLRVQRGGRGAAKGLDRSGYRPPSIISWLSIATRSFPRLVLETLFPQWPKEQLLVLRRLLNSPDTIRAALTMAHDEMRTIRDLEGELLQSHAKKIHAYYGVEDNWVLERDREEVVGILFPQDPDSIKILRCKQGIPHAFCINHGRQMARQCAAWDEGHL